jgi:hypothetical protein
MDPNCASYSCNEEVEWETECYVYSKEPFDVDCFIPCLIRYKYTVSIPNDITSIKYNIMLHFSLTVLNLCPNF